MSLFVFRPNPPQTDSGDDLNPTFHEDQGHDGDRDFDNPLITTLGQEFFRLGKVLDDQVASMLQKTLAFFEDTSVSDMVITSACQHADFLLVTFMLRVIIADRAESPIAARCLALASNIYAHVWVDYAAHDIHMHVTVLLRAIYSMLSMIKGLQAANVPVQRRGSYLGYDERDKKDFNMEGYDEFEEEFQAALQARELKQENMLIYALLCTQCMSHPHDILDAYIHNCRDHYASHGIPFPDYISKHLTEVDTSTPQTVPEVLEQLEHNADLFHTCTLFVLHELTSLALTIACTALEDCAQQAMKFIVQLSGQVAVISGDIPSNEIVNLFIIADCSMLGQGKLTQSLMYILNENGYPNMHIEEARSAITFITQLLHDPFHYSGEEPEGGGGLEVRGHFYVNDVKILLEICIRELTNIPVHDHVKLRFAYLRLIEAIITKSAWSTSTDFYMRSNIRELLMQLAAQDEDPLIQDVSQELLVSQTELLGSSG
eukprot:gene29358-35440_t